MICFAPGGWRTSRVLSVNRAPSCVGSRTVQESSARPEPLEQLGPECLVEQGGSEGNEVVRAILDCAENACAFGGNERQVILEVIDGLADLVRERSVIRPFQKDGQAGGCAERDVDACRERDVATASRSRPVAAVAFLAGCVASEPRRR